MIYSIDDKIVTIDGMMLERKVKQLTFQVQGKWFPHSYYDNYNTNYTSGSEAMTFESSTPNSVTVNYGDGTVVVHDFALINGRYIVEFRIESTLSYAVPQHTFTDGNEGVRNVSFEFTNPEGLTKLVSSFLRLTGILPSEINAFENVRELRYSRGLYVDSIPDTFPEKLSIYAMTNTLRVKKDVIEDAIFDRPITSLALNADYNLSDVIGSNLFKINQLKNTLVTSNLESCEIVELPDSLAECSKLSDFRIGSNKFTKIPSVIGELTALRLLYIGSTVLTDTSIPVWSNCKELKSMRFLFPQADLSGIPLSWRYLYSLDSLMTFYSFISSSSRFDGFIEAMYELCTINGSMTPDANAYGGVYPNRFRSISWGHAALSFTGAKIAPSGYVQGVSNGTPTTSGQKAYVLQNQYNHTITHGTPL